MLYRKCYITKRCHIAHPMTVSDSETASAGPRWCFTVYPLEAGAAVAKCGFAPGPAPASATMIPALGDYSPGQPGESGSDWV